VTIFIEKRAVIKACLYVTQHNYAPFGFQYPQSSCCTSPSPLSTCEIVQEGEQLMEDTGSDGVTYLLIQDQASWTAARDICNASHGGKIAHLQTGAQMDRVVDLIAAAGVNNAW
jgi:hypothetical protein